MKEEINSAGGFMFNPFWLEYLLNLFHQGFPGDVFCEIEDTIINFEDAMKSEVYLLMISTLNNVEEFEDG